MKDAIGDRMKNQYENRTRIFLPRRTYTIIRLDGKAFHTFTKDMERPYDKNFMTVMNETAKFICEEIQGAKIAYVQSDEISVLLTDFDKITTDAWFDGNIQKIVSVGASLATAKFNDVFKYEFDPLETKMAFFDARTFTIPDRTEVSNYFIWRQKDAVRNSIAMTAQNLYSHKELEGKSSKDQLDMIYEKGDNWNKMPSGFKRGRIVIYESKYDKEVNLEALAHGATVEEAEKSAMRGFWNVIEAPDFVKDVYSGDITLDLFIPNYDPLRIIKKN